MDRMERWKLADEWNVYQIALLIAGYDPSEFEDESYHRWPEEVKREVSLYLNSIKKPENRQSRRSFPSPSPHGGGCQGWALPEARKARA
jgi:hypothetical protein